jgi:hypothetical protein
MGTKNQIKIDSFTVERLGITDIPEVLRLASKAQASFGITETVSPSMFFREITENIQVNLENSFAFRSNKGLMIGAFVFHKITSVSCEMVYIFSHPNVLQTQIMRDALTDQIRKLPFDHIFVYVFKKRKRLNTYLKLVKSFRFEEVIEDNDSFVKLKYKKS